MRGWMLSAAGAALVGVLGVLAQFVAFGSVEIALMGVASVVYAVGKGLDAYDQRRWAGRVLAMRRPRERLTPKARLWIDRQPEGYWKR